MRQLVTSLAVYSIAIFMWFSLSSAASTIISHYIRYTYQKNERKNSYVSNRPE